MSLCMYVCTVVAMAPPSPMHLASCIGERAPLAMWGHCKRRKEERFDRDALSQEEMASHCPGCVCVCVCAEYV